MFTTTQSNLAAHFIKDLGIRPDDLVFMFTGLFGLGRLENGLATIEGAIEEALPKGTLIIPTFSYSWSQGQKFNKDTECPEMGNFSNYVLGKSNYKRSSNPNFSVSIRVNDYNQPLADHFLNVGDDCFGDKSIFSKVVEYGQKNRAWILLLGGAFNDVKYRSTFIHYAQQKVGVPHRYVKTFCSPDGSDRRVTQLVRCFSEAEYLENGGNSENRCFKFPVEEDYSSYGEEVESSGLLVQKQFGYYPSRMISVKESVDFYMARIRENPYYCIDKNSLNT